MPIVDPGGNLFVDGEDPRRPSAQPGVPAPLGPIGPEPAAPLYPSEQHVIESAFRLNNPIVSVIDALRRSRPDGPEDPSYDPIPRVMGSKYEPYIDQFLADWNAAETDARMAKIDQEENDRRVLAASGWGGIAAGIAAGALDPSWFIPIAGEASAAGKGLSLAARVGRGAVEGALRSTVSEAALMASQDTRTGGEAIQDIGTQTLFMGLVGAGGALLDSGERRAAVEGLDKVRTDLSPPKPGETVPHEIPVDERPTPQPKVLADVLAPVGAGMADSRTMELARIGLPASAQAAIAKLPGGQTAIDLTNRVTMSLSPTLRIASSSSLEAKRAMFDLSETALKFTQNALGITNARGGAPVDQAVRLQQNRLKLKSSGILQEEWMAHRGVKGMAAKKAQMADLRGVPPGKLSWPEFKERVTLAGSGGDQDAIPEVARAAQRIRAQALDPVTTLAQSVKDRDGRPMLADALEAPKGDKSFFPRLWSKQKLAARYNEAKGTFTDWLAGEQTRKQGVRDTLTRLRERRDALPEDDAVGRRAVQQDIEAQIKGWGGKTTDEAIAALKARAKKEADRKEGKPPLKEADRKVDAAVDKILASERLDLSRDELSSRSEEIIRRIMAGPDGRLPYDAPTGGPQIGPPGKGNEVRGSLNARDFAIPTHLVKGFIETDAERVLAAHLRTAIPDIHLTSRFGDVNMEEAFRKVDEEYGRKLAGVTGEKAQKSINREHDVVVRDLAATRDRIRSVYGWSLAAPHPKAARVANAMRNYNMLADLGTSVFNRLTDSVNAIGRHGMMNVFGDAYMPFFKGLLGIEKTQWQAAKQSMHDMAIGVGSELGHISHQYDDAFNDFLPGNRFERGLGILADKSMILNLHGPWTDTMKRIGGTVAQANLLRATEDVAAGKAGAKQIEQLAQSGIDQAAAERIWQQFSSTGGGQTFGKRTHIANTAAWSDRNAAEVFSSAIARDADMTVLTPGAEKPLWMSDPIYSLMGQYKSFVAAAYEKLLISNLQQMDVNTLQQFVASMAVGALSYRLYTLLSGQPMSLSPQDLIKEAISRSAITAWLSEVNSIQAKFTGGQTDMFRLIGADKPLSRRASEGALADMLGPTYSKMEGLAGGLNDISHGTWNAMDTHKLRQAVILQNLWGLRRALDDAEDGFNEAMGIKPLNREPRY